MALSKSPQQSQYPATLEAHAHSHAHSPASYSPHSPHSPHSVHSNADSSLSSLSSRHSTAPSSPPRRGEEEGGGEGKGGEGLIGETGALGAEVLDTGEKVDSMESKVEPPPSAASRSQPVLAEPLAEPPQDETPVEQTSTALDAKDTEVDVASAPPEPAHKPILPDHYWETSLGGRTGIPVFKPTWEEFKDFDVFMQNVDHYGAQAGVIKVIPPREWREALPSVRPRVQSCKIKNAVTQEMLGGLAGSFAIASIVTSKKYRPQDWWALCQAKKTPGLKVTEDVVAEESPSKRRRVRGGKNDSRSGHAESVAEVPVEKPEQTCTEDRIEETPMTPAPPIETSLSSAEATEELLKPENDDDDELDLKRAECSTQASVPEDDFDPYLTPPEELEQYTKEFCQDLERRYWRDLSQKPWAAYGADVKGSLFTDETQHWNVANLPNMLSRVKQKIPGVNTPYLYWGMYKASFPWHLEDMDLYSINYIHFGAPKQWYVVPPAEADRMKSVMAGLFSPAANTCPEFLRHKAFLASPKVLRGKGITVQRVVQHEGEFIITFPYGYHSGYNLGFNCAESVNFALERWLDIGRKSGVCQCVDHSVRINVDELFTPENLKPEFGGIVTKKSRPVREATRPEKIVKEAPAPVKKKKVVCVLCPSKVEEDLLPTPVEDEMAHRICALAIPGPYVAIDPVSGVETVYGVEWVDKERKTLKCAICGIKGQGACIQCSKPKCAAPFHPSCVTWGVDGSGLDRKNEISGVSLQLKETEVELLLPSNVPQEAHATKKDTLEDGETHQCAMIEANENPDTAAVAGVRDDAPVQPEKPEAVTEHVPQSTSEGTAMQVEQAGVSSEASGQATVGLPASQLPEGSAVVPTPTMIQTTYSVALCRRHNPAYAEMKRIAKIQALKETIGSLQQGSRVTVRASGGLFSGTVLAVSEQGHSATVQFDEGTVNNVPWARISMIKEVEEDTGARLSKAHGQADFIYEGPAKTFRTPTHNAGTRAAAQSSVPELKEGGLVLGKRPLRPW